MRNGAQHRVKLHAGVGILLGAAFCGLIGYFLTEVPPRVDDPVHLKPLLGNLLIFLFWWLGLYGWGRFFCRILAWPRSTFYARLSGALALGSLFAYLSVFMMMGTLNLSAMAPRLLAYFWSAGGILLGYREFSEVSAEPVSRPHLRLGRLGKFLRSPGFCPGFWLTSLAIASVPLRALEAVHLSESGDPYVCYLTAMRLWFDARSFAPFMESPIQFLASAWDTLNQWGNLFFATEPGRGLAEAQRFAQWISAGVGYSGLGAVLAALFLPEKNRRSDPHQLRWLWVALIAGLSVPCLRWTFALAKNDTGVCFWALAALIPLRFLVHGSLKNTPYRPAIAAGLLLGAAVIAKPTSVVFAFTAVLFFTIRLKWKDRDREESARAAFPVARILGFLVGAGLIAGAPILLRNTLLTGNPFYPWVNHLFHNSIAGPTLEEGFAVATRSQGPRSPMTFLLLWWYIREILVENYFNIFSVVLLFVVGIQLFHRKRLAIPRLGQLDLAIIAWLASILFCLTLRRNTEIRYLGPALPLLAVSGVCGAGDLVLWLESKIGFKKLRSLALLGAGLAVVAASGIPFFLLLQLDSRHFSPPYREVLGHFGGPAKHWLRQHAKPGELIAAIGDNEVYYALPLRLSEMRFNPVYDRAFWTARSPSDMIGIMKKLGIKYYYRAPVTPSPDSHRFLFLLDAAMKDQDHCARFSEGKARVYDVGCLNPGLNPNSP